MTIAKGQVATEVQTDPVPGCLGTLTGKTTVARSNVLGTDQTGKQELTSYTVPEGKNFFLSLIELEAAFTSISTTAARLGLFMLEHDETQILGSLLVNPSNAAADVRCYPFSEPIGFPSGAELKFFVQPSTGTSIGWRLNFYGYERAAV